MASGTLETFLSLGLENIPDDWVCQLWSDNFCESSPLSVDDHDVLCNESNWQAVVYSATGWLDSSNAEAEGTQNIRLVFLSIENAVICRVSIMGGSG